MNQASKTPAPAPAPAQKQYGGYGQAPATVAESVGFRDDELNRILTLIHHR
jgi:hypothetical protein